MHLKGAAIIGQNPEANRLETNALTFEDIHNHSSSKASSGSLNLNLKQTADEQIDNKTGKVVKENAPDSTLVKGERSGGVNGGLPMSQSDSDSSLTKATLSEGTIILTKDTTPIATTAKALGINTELAQANPQVETPKDVNKQLDEQRQIREAAGHIQTAVNKYIDVQQKAIAKEIKVLQSQKEAAEARGDSAQANALDEQILNARISQDQWGTGGEYKRATEALTQAVLMGVSGGSAQAIAAAGASPYVNQVIKDVTKDIPSLNLPAHVIWGAIEAELTGGHATTGAISTAAGELGAAYLAEHIFGKKAAELSPEERSKVRDAAKAIAGIAGGLSSAMQGQDLVSSLNDTSVGLTVANNAVENNYLSIADVQNLIRELSKAQKEGRDIKPILEKYKGISEENRQQLIACNGNVACETAHLHEMNTGAEELERNLGFFSRMVVYYPNDLNTANRIALSNLVESEYAESFSKLSDTIKFGLNAMEAGTAIGLGAVAGYAKVGLSNVKSLINGKNKTYPPSGMDGYKRANVGDEDYPEGIHFSMNLKNHLIQGEGINQRRGVIGGHNRENFINTLSQGGGRIVKEESTNVDGITRIHYEIPRLGRDGKPDGTYKAISSPKTVYDPIKFSDHEMLEMGQKAVAKGYVSSVKASNDYLKNYQDSQQINGIKFRYYIDKDTKGVTNVHPE
ncbi:CdiA family toxin C-terminal domain-containing protein [Haemophilus pittmaniae]|uniref:CdiA family toxin C-terminal domain-containing protein n=1 Tax=Haemophilus pittmaniae TaxID=249188 RepID=UPI0011C03850|nr:CdiA family toxin C-terminal domain-containing protein [Haemophilus pittmaniae]